MTWGVEGRRWQTASGIFVRLAWLERGQEKRCDQCLQGGRVEAEVTLKVGSLKKVDDWDQYPKGINSHKTRRIWGNDWNCRDVGGVEE
jgi:hypothetical protein